MTHPIRDKSGGRRDSDEQLAKAAALGDCGAFETLVHRYEPRLRKYLMLRAGNLEFAEDCLQETLMEAYRYVDRFDTAWKFSTWIFTIARRVFVRLAKESPLNRALRSRAAGFCESDNGHRLGLKSEEWGASVQALLLDEQTPEEVATASEARLDFWGWVKCHVTTGEYQALRMSYIEGRPISEIAHKLHRTEKGTKSLLSRARVKLRGRLNLHQEDWQRIRGLMQLVKR